MPGRWRQKANASNATFCHWWHVPAALLSPLNHHMISMLTDLLVATNVDEEHAAAELAAPEV